MTSKILFIFSLIGLSIVFLLRLDVETSNMASPRLKEIVNSQTSYKTKLMVRDDIESTLYSKSFVASDQYIKHRVLAISDSINNSLVSGLRVGDEIVVEGYLLSLNNFQKYRLKEHVIAVFKIEKIFNITKSNNVLYATSQRFRDIVTFGCLNLSKDSVGVCQGLLIGEKNKIDKKVYDQYRKSQLTHILVASGANIAFLLGFIMPLTKNKSLNFRMLLMISVSLFYCFATRFEPSILRASLMVLLPSLFAMNGYKISQLKILILTIFLSLCLDPFLFYRVGFWLSASATYGLIVVSPKINKYLKAQILSNTISATICVQPVLWRVFGYSFPIRWWASVIGVFIAEILSSIGMFIIGLSGLVGQKNIVTALLILPMDFGIKTLNFIAFIGSSEKGKFIGWTLTGLCVIAYTYKLRKQNLIGKSNGQNSILYNRR
ncbi:MAG: ComEC/Rec2 family competence protein [Acidimicrobiia bacterium]